VKRIVPAAFLPYDYWQETPTRLLWAMEGITSYYGELTLVRSGLWSVSRYLQHLANEIQTLESLPARAHLSLAQASFDGWLSDPAQMHDHANAWFSFYTKGELVAALLDLTILRATDRQRSLDDVMRILWNDYGQRARGLEEDAVERAVARICDVGDFFARYVYGVEALPYDDAFAAAGIRFEIEGGDPDRASLAAKLKTAEGALVVLSVIRGGAGMAAGLLPGDEIVAADGMRVTTEAALDSALRGLSIGSSASLLVSRAGVLRELTLPGAPDPRRRVRLNTEHPSDLRRAWLRRDE
jgi:predicted metalloprotease with PDZ domain